MTKSYSKSEKGFEERKRLKKVNFIKKLKLKRNLEKLKKEEGLLGYSNTCITPDTTSSNTTDTSTATTTNSSTAQNDVIKGSRVLPPLFTRDFTKTIQLNNRKEKRSNHMKKTRKGQPILSNQIGMILEKLQKQS